MLTKQDLKQIETLLGQTEVRITDKTEKEITTLRREMKREFKKVHADQNLIINHFNKEYLGLQDRVETLEQKAKSPNFS